MKTKLPIMIFIIGLAITMIGAALKINEFTLGNTFILVGIIIQSIGLVMLGYKLITNSKFKDLMNK